MAARVAVFGDDSRGVGFHLGGGVGSRGIGHIFFVVCGFIVLFFLSVLYRDVMSDLCRRCATGRFLFGETKGRISSVSRRQQAAQGVRGRSGKDRGRRRPRSGLRTLTWWAGVGGTDGILLGPIPSLLQSDVIGVGERSMDPAMPFPLKSRGDDRVPCDRTPVACQSAAAFITTRAARGHSPEQPDAAAQSMTARKRPYVIQLGRRSSTSNFLFCCPRS